MVRWCAVAWALLWGIWLPGGAIAAGTMSDCFADLERGTSDYIVCAFPLNPSPNERATVLAPLPAEAPYLKNLLVDGDQLFFIAGSTECDRKGILLMRVPRCGGEPTLLYRASTSSLHGLVSDTQRVYFTDDRSVSWVAK